MGEDDTEEECGVSEGSLYLSEMSLILLWRFALYHETSRGSLDDANRNRNKRSDKVSDIGCGAEELGVVDDVCLLKRGNWRFR